MHIENVFEMVTQPQAQFELAVQLEIGIHVQLPDMVQWFACVQMQGIVCETRVRIQLGPLRQGHCKTMNFSKQFCTWRHSFQDIPQPEEVMPKARITAVGPFSLQPPLALKEVSFMLEKRWLEATSNRL